MPPWHAFITQGRGDGTFLWIPNVFIARIWFSIAHWRPGFSFVRFM